MIEVRRCRRCGEAAAVCVRDWKHTTFGVASGSSTQDFRCQSCGAWFTLRPKMRLWVFGVMTVLFVWTIVLPMLFGPLIAWWVWPYVANPIVPDAPPPPMRFRAAEPLRRCTSCGGAARCVSITRNSTNMIPTGTDYEYACLTCDATFSLESTWGTVFTSIAGLFVFLLGFGCLPFGILLWLMALVVFAMSTFKVINRFRHPIVVEQPEAT